MKVGCRSESRWIPNLATRKVCPVGDFDYQTWQCDPAHVGATVDFFINSIVTIEEDTVVDVIEDFSFAVDDSSSNNDVLICFCIRLTKIDGRGGTEYSLMLRIMIPGRITMLIGALHPYLISTRMYVKLQK
ncbi:OLC1v1018103C1 [Oldenlandia corymbosa var. corymbosa]|uniref:OLC1v1018103C1 n=1 Tax=Oldenlandia corymbosa var. corymbosa TaxID=529605 RepID=A0AAV1EAW2_OLDCO|nr:OLC1v1018103C1 [Oldenlandia corymbosa var. corymbosa]